MYVVLCTCPAQQKHSIAQFTSTSVLPYFTSSIDDLPQLAFMVVNSKVVPISALPRICIYFIYMMALSVKHKAFFQMQG